MGKKNRRNRSNSQGKGSRGPSSRDAPSRESSEAAEGKSDEGKGKKDENALVEWIKSLAVALVAFLVIRSFLVHTFVIISGSMEETLLVGDLLLVNRAAVGSHVPGTSWRIPGYSKLERGDVLVFDPPHEEDLKLVKRLMGLPGDTVEMRNKVLLVNGEALDEPYAQHSDIRDDVHPWMSWQAEYAIGGGSNGSYAPTRDNWGPIVIPEDRYFMLGDNRDTSLDSRYWGFVKSDRIKGKAFFIYWSWNRQGSFAEHVRWDRLGKLLGLMPPGQALARE